MAQYVVTVDKDRACLGIESDLFFPSFLLSLLFFFPPQAYEFKTAGDSWFLEEGCPPGTYLKNKESLKAGCSNCPLGTYNDNTDPAPSCDVCPVGTTTRKTERQRKTQCDVCNLTAQTPFGACIVENYKSVWTCNPGGYGPECSKLGCGGIQIERQKLCYGQGTCSGK